jgi:hypothetical protein
MNDILLAQLLKDRNILVENIQDLINEFAKKYDLQPEGIKLSLTKTGYVKIVLKV